MLSISEDEILDDHRCVYFSMNNERLANIKIMRHESMPSIILELKLIEITILLILGADNNYVELTGVNIFSRMMSFDDLIQQEFPNEIIQMPCVTNKVQNIERQILINFIIFCGKVANKLKHDNITIDIKNPESIREFFEELFDIIKYM